MRLAGIESDSELVTILEKNGVLKAGLVFLVRADKPTLAKMTTKVKERNNPAGHTTTTTNQQNVYHNDPVLVRLRKSLQNQLFNKCLK